MTLGVVSDGADVREALVEASHRAGVGLREIRGESMTLEEFFVSVTARQAQQTAGAAGGEAA